MAGVRLEFAQFGGFDYFEIVRSQTPIDVSNLPAAIVTNLKTMYYVDTNIVPGETYYYRVLAYRNESMVISNEIECLASTASKYATLLHFHGADGATVFYDHAATENWNSLDATISTASAKIGGSSAKFKGTTTSYIYRYTNLVITGNFSISFYLNMTQSQNGYIILWNYGTATIRFGDSGFGDKLQVALQSGSINTVFSCALTKADFAGKGWKKIEFRRIGTQCSVHVDDVQQNVNLGINPSTYPYSSFPDNSQIKNFDQPAFDVMRIGQSLIGYIDEFSIKRLS